jgi:LysM domain
MGNDNSMLRRATVAAFGAVFALAAGCATRQAATEEESAMTPYEPAAPDTAPSEGVESGELREDAPMRYVVKKGDTLWSISNKFLKDSWQWPELWYVNPKVKNPHLIYPGDELFLYFVDGQAHVARSGEGEPAPGTGDGGSRQPAEVLPPGGQGTFAPTARVLPVEQAITAIPAEQIRAFLRGPRVIDEDELDDAPYIVAFEEKKLLGAADSVAYVMDADKSVSQYHIVRRSKEYEDPDSGDDLGYEVMSVGEAEVRVFGDPTTVYILRSDMEARVGDFLLPMETDPLALRFIPHAPGKDIDAKVMSVYQGMSQIGQFQIVALNRGKRDGMETGHVLSVMQTGERAKDPNAFFGGSVQLPDLHAGTLMVFKVGERVSHALVMSSSRAVHIGDRVERPAGSEPSK